VLVAADVGLKNERRMDRPRDLDLDHNDLVYVFHQRLECGPESFSAGHNIPVFDDRWSDMHLYRAPTALQTKEVLDFWPVKTT